MICKSVGHSVRIAGIKAQKRRPGVHGLEGLFRLQVTILAVEVGQTRGRKTRRPELWNYLHNCKVKAVLREGGERGEGGNKELSVWAAPFGQGEILSAATTPSNPPRPVCQPATLPTSLHPASRADCDSAAGWAESVPRPTAPN